MLDSRDKQYMLECITVLPLVNNDTFDTSHTVEFPKNTGKILVIHKAYKVNDLEKVMIVSYEHDPETVYIISRPFSQRVAYGAKGNTYFTMLCNLDLVPVVPSDSKTDNHNNDDTIKVHKGSLVVAHSLLDDKTLPINILMKSKRIFITGHSLGGAFSHLLTLLLKEHYFAKWSKAGNSSSPCSPSSPSSPPETFTISFGAARIGNQAFANWFVDNKVYCKNIVAAFRNMRVFDPITGFPSSISKSFASVPEVVIIGARNKVEIDHDGKKFTREHNTNLECHEIWKILKRQFSWKQEWVILTRLLFLHFLHCYAYRM